MRGRVCLLKTDIGSEMNSWISASLIFTSGNIVSLTITLDIIIRNITHLGSSCFYLLQS